MRKNFGHVLVDFPELKIFDVSNVYAIEPADLSLASALIDFVDGGSVNDSVLDFAERLGDGVQTILSFIDKVRIRNYLRAALRTTAGELLSQQYGFSSGFLDASYSLRVAAFFATHKSPEFLVPLISSEEVGVIFRFKTARNGEIRRGWSELKKQQTVDYFDCYFELDKAYAHHIRAEWVPADDQFAPDFLSATIGNVDLQGSRVGRQESVMIVPHLTSNGAVISGVENLRHREGTSAFYFKHSPESASMDRLSRNYLWPTFGDDFKTAITRVLANDVLMQVSSPEDLGNGYLRVSRSYFLPHRPERVDPGYTLTEDEDSSSGICCLGSGLAYEGTSCPTLASLTDLSNLMRQTVLGSGLNKDQFRELLNTDIRRLVSICKSDLQNYPLKIFCFHALSLNRLASFRLFFPDDDWFFKTALDDVLTAGICAELHDSLELGLLFASDVVCACAYLCVSFDNSMTTDQRRRWLYRLAKLHEELCDVRERKNFDSHDMNQFLFSSSQLINFGLSAMKAES
ncbi:hypothetical protein CR51_27030 [Caballeronia megalochromosomata]|nr:hypothetical protein CR51_27030 [Caballeronia megalochromosomata]